MPAIAIRMPTVNQEFEAVPGGHCYVLFQEPEVKVRDLIIEKVRAECRKLRAGGQDQSSLSALLPTEYDKQIFNPWDENMAEAAACRAFLEGEFSIRIVRVMPKKVEWLPNSQDSLWSSFTVTRNMTVQFVTNAPDDDNEPQWDFVEATWPPFL